jgi:uncharacterized protein
MLSRPDPHGLSAPAAAYPGAVSEPDQTLTAPAERAPVRWGLGDAAAGWLIAQIGGLIALSVVLAVSGYEPGEVDDMPLGWVALAQTGLWAGLGGVPWVVARLKGNGIVRDFGLRVRVGDLWVGLGAGLGAHLLTYLLYVPLYVVFDLSSEDVEEQARQLTDRAQSPVSIALLVIIAGIGAPIFEEIFYRGLLLRSMERRVGTWPAVVVTGVLFGLSHLQLLQLPALILFGIVAGVLTVRSGRLGPAIAAHVVFNLVAVVTLLQGT